MNDIYCIGDLGRGDDSMVGGYHRAAPSTINQSNVTAPSGRIEHWVNASAQTSPIQIQSISQSINKINQSIIKTINQSIVQQINVINKTIQSTITTAKFQVHAMKLQTSGCTPPFELGCGETPLACATYASGTGAHVELQPPPRECPVPW